MSASLKYLAKISLQKDLNDDLSKTSEQAFQQKIQFNPGVNKQSSEVYFAAKHNTDDHIPIKINGRHINCMNHKIFRCSLTKAF